MAEKRGESKPPPGIDQFNDLMRKLVKVPKGEMDAEVKKDRRRRAKRKADRRGK